jgi:hypothetical protein
MAELFTSVHHHRTVSSQLIVCAALQQPHSGDHAGSEALLMGDANKAIEAVLLAVEVNCDTHLKPPPFWTHFYSVTAYVIDYITASQGAAGTQLSDEPPVVKGAASNAVPTPAASPATMPSEAAPARPGRKKSQYARQSQSQSPSDVLADVPSTQPSAPSRSPSMESCGENANGAAAAPVPSTPSTDSNAPVAGGLPPLGAGLQRSVVLSLSRFWLTLAKRLSVALISPETHTSNATQRAAAGGQPLWRMPTTSYASDHMLLRNCALAHVRQVLASDEEGVLEDILALPEFKAMVSDMLFHVDSDVRTECKALLGDSALSRRPTAQQQALHVRSLALHACL